MDADEAPRVEALQQLSFIGADLPEDAEHHALALFIVVRDVEREFVSSIQVS